MSFIFKIIEGQSYNNDLAFLLFELDQTYFPTPWNQQSWSDLFLDHDRLLGLVEQGDEVVGFALLDVAIADSFAHLLKICVKSELRSKKIGNQLLDFSIKELEKKGVAEFFLEVEDTNISAIKLYESLRFKRIHFKKDFYGTGRGALIMTRTLAL